MLRFSGCPLAPSPVVNRRNGAKFGRQARNPKHRGVEKRRRQHLRQCRQKSRVLPYPISNPRTAGGKRAADGKRHHIRRAAIQCLLISAADECSHHFAILRRTARGQFGNYGFNFPRVSSTAGVLIAPGSTVHTRMPNGRNSNRRVSLNFPNALLLALSRPPNGRAMCTPTELMLTIRPITRRSRGSNACVTAIWPNTLISNICCKSVAVAYSTAIGDVHDGRLEIRSELAPQPVAVSRLSYRGENSPSGPRHLGNARQSDSA